MNIRNSLLIFTLVALSLALPAPATADAPEPKGFKFKPVRSEDWPETGEAEGGNRTSTDDDGEGGGDRAPASTGMPNMKMNPDGTIDPSSFKQFF
jgi:hypothetical protein